MSMRFLITGVIGLLALYLATDSVFTVHETQRAIVLRFGAVLRGDVAPGLHLKWPIADEVKKFDGRKRSRRARRPSNGGANNRRWANRGQLPDTG